MQKQVTAITQPPSDRRDEIINAALALFRARGLAAVSTRDLADYAGLSRSHVYHYFEDWNALRLAAFEKFAQAEVAALRGALRDLTPTEALPAFIGFCLPKRQDASWSLWIDAGVEALHDAQLGSSFTQAQAAVEKLLHDIIEDGIVVGMFSCPDAARTARQLMAITNGYADELLYAHKPKKVRAAQEEIMQVAALLLAPRKADR